MRIIALYDIHGNVDALEAVLGDVAAQGPDAIVIGGDAVPGAFASATLDRIEVLSTPAHWVRGNGEREVAEAAERADALGDTAAAAGGMGAGGDGRADTPESLPERTAALSAEQLGAERARALGKLPATVELDGVLFCHATPGSDMEILTRISPPERWGAALAGVGCKLVVAGHTHQQDDRIVGDVRFVNAGSVGLPYEGDGAARWALIVDGVPELRSTAYDSVATGKRMLATGWPDEGSITGALIEPADALEVTQIFEAMAGA